DASAGAVAGALESPVGLENGYAVTVTKRDSSNNPVNITRADGAPIDGQASVSLVERGDFQTFVVDNDDWYTFGANSASGLQIPIPVSQGGTGANNAPDARTNLGLGNAAVLDAGVGPNELVQRDAAGNIPGIGSASSVTPIARGGTGATSAAGARTNLGLGTASTRNTGTQEGNVPLIGPGNVLDAAVLPPLKEVDGGIRTVRVGTSPTGSFAGIDVTALAAGTYVVILQLTFAGQISNPNELRFRADGATLHAFRTPPNDTVVTEIGTAIVTLPATFDFAGFGVGLFHDQRATFIRIG
ncbi:MAG: hypothetical protein ACR2RB_15790, partial [Gammaproteobacteria bacterium]